MFFVWTEPSSFSSNVEFLWVNAVGYKELASEAFY